MKKTYSKPEVCVLDCESGKTVSTSESFTQRIVEKIDEYNWENKEAFVDGRKISCKS